MIQDLPALLWVVNLGCIDLNQWYARCDDVDRPDYVHFDLDPVKGPKPVPFARVRETALIVRDGLDALGMPVVRQDHRLARHPRLRAHRARAQPEGSVELRQAVLAVSLDALHPKLITAEYAVARRPQGHVLVDYNQNAWGQTLASIYSVRPHPKAAVSTPVTWDEIEDGVEIEDFHIRNVPERVREDGRPVGAAPGAERAASSWRNTCRPR